MTMMPDPASTIDEIRPELIDIAATGRWSDLDVLRRFTQNHDLTPLDRFGRVLPAFVMARSDSYDQETMAGFIDFARDHLQSSNWFRMEDKLGLNALDYACFSPYRLESARFIQLVVSLAVLRGEGIPLPNLPRAASVILSSELEDSLANARAIIVKSAIKIAESRNAVATLFRDDDCYENLLGKNQIRGSFKDIALRYREAANAWKQIKVPFSEDVSCPPIEAELLLGEHCMFGGRPIDKKLRDVMVKHVALQPA